jgi:hypothetical protein
MILDKSASSDFGAFPGRSAASFGVTCAVFSHRRQIHKEVSMLSPVEIAAVIAAIKGSVDVFDKMAGPIKRVILGQPKFEQDEAKDQRWRFRVETEGKDVVVKQGDYTRQMIIGTDLSKKLGPNDLVVVQTYERKM